MDVKAYEARLLNLRARLNHEVEELIEGMQEELHVPGDFPRSTHPADQATECLDRDVALIANEQALKSGIDLALERIRLGSYGQCASCGQPIAEERLQAIPYAINCRACAEQPDGGRAS
jgi:RNA polymerase-binding transcription factor DksA